MVTKNTSEKNHDKIRLSYNKTANYMTNDNVLHIAVEEFFITLQKSHVRLKHDKMRKNGSLRLHHWLDILHLTVKYIPQ